MLNLLGDDYISQHLAFLLKKYYDDKLYKIYVTDCLYAISQGSIKKRWIEISEPKPEQEEKSIDELVAMVKKIK